MFRETFVLATALMIGGCAASARLDPEMGQSDQQQTGESARMAAFAAQAEYPQDQQAQDSNLGAVVNRSTGSVKIYNFGDESIENAEVWVNGRYVTEVDTIGRGESVTLPRSKFFNRDGQSLARLNDPMTRVQVRVDDQFYNVQGPIFEAPQQQSPPQP